MKNVNILTSPNYRQRQAQATRALIIANAQSLFIERGYGTTTIEDIASRAGVAVSTVYAIFKSKRGILKAIRETWHEATRIREVVYAQGAFTAPAERIEALAKATRQQWESGSVVIKLYTSAAASEPEAAAELSEALRGRRKGLAAFVSDLMPHLRKDLDETHAAAILYALCMPELYDELVNHDHWSADEYQAWLSKALKSELLEPA